MYLRNFKLLFRISTKCRLIDADAALQGEYGFVIHCEQGSFIVSDMLFIPGNKHPNMSFVFSSLTLFINFCFIQNVGTV